MQEKAYFDFGVIDSYKGFKNLGLGYHIVNKSNVDTQLPVATICERCDDKPTRIAKIFITIHDGCGDHTYGDHTLFIVIPKLSNPLEIIDVADVILCHLLYDIASC